MYWSVTLGVRPLQSIYKLYDPNGSMTLQHFIIIFGAVQVLLRPVACMLRIPMLPGSKDGSIYLHLQHTSIWSSSTPPELACTRLFCSWSCRSCRPFTACGA